jgi:hypothetical protein
MAYLFTHQLHQQTIHTEICGYLISQQEPESIRSTSKNASAKHLDSDSGLACNTLCYLTGAHQTMTLSSKAS